MRTKLPALSLFFPTFNEEGNIKDVVAKAVKVLPNISTKWEVIIVNDGSSDKTKEVASVIAQANKHVRLVNHKINRGYGGALKTGYESAKYDWVAFADADGQFDPSELSSLVAQTDSADLVLGYRLKRADSLKRIILTWGWKSLARILLGLSVRDYSCGFKLIKKEVYERVQPLVGEEKVTQIEMLVKAKRLGFRIAEVGVHHYPRTSGSQTGANFAVFAKSLMGLFKLWWILK